MRHKKKQELMKVKSAVSIDNNLLNLLNIYLEDNNINNKSKFIESLIKEDLEYKGFNFTKKF